MSLSTRLLGVLAAALALGFVRPVAGPAAAPSNDPLPAGPGKEVVMRVCTACHGVEQFAYARFTPDGWDIEINKMRAAGALMTSDEADTALTYLSKYLSKPEPPQTKAPSGG